jgi:hypothetical protein
MLEQRLNHVRWKMMQNENKMRSMLDDTKQLRELDVVADLSSNRVDEKIGWMKAVIEDELKQPLIIPERPPDLYDLEDEQRREVVRFDKHLRVVELMADKLRANNPDAVDEAFAKSKRELLHDCGMEVLQTERSSAAPSYRSRRSSGRDDRGQETALSDYLAMVGTLETHDRPTGGIGDDPMLEIRNSPDGDDEDVVPAVTRLALLHRELTEEKAKHLNATNELIRYQKSEFNIRR